MKIIVTSFKRRNPCTNCYIQCPQPCSTTTDPRLCQRETPGHSPESLGQSLVGSLLLSPGSWCSSFCLFPPRVCCPVRCKFWRLYGVINGDLLQEVLCYTQVCCTQNPYHCGSPLLTCTSTGDTQTQLCLSICGVSGPWCTQGIFEHIGLLWQVWSLFLNTILPLLPSCWGFTFALGK